jgi:hypothetical protein
VQGPAGLSTGVTAGNETHVPVDGGPNDPITVLTGPPVPTSGTYYLTASLTLEIASGDFIGCGFPNSTESTAQEVGPAPAQMFASMSLNGAVSLTAGQAPTITCINANVGSSTQTGEGDISAILIDNSTSGSGNGAARHQGVRTLKLALLGRDHQ